MAPQVPGSGREREPLSSSRLAGARGLRAVLLPAAALALASCGADGPTGPPPVEQGQFRATLSGEYTDTLAGAATMGVLPDGAGKEHFVLILVSSDSRNMLSVSRETADRPETGVHTAGGVGSDFRGVFDQRGSDFELLRTFVTRSGHVRITQSSGAGLRGTFAIVFDGSGPETNVGTRVTLKGEFASACVGACR